ncbi:NADP-dependent oxidoreductase [Histidinibacterium aquaticum]|uniref:NADP-dependent oxidoreductase n=1 Tax=Histidinibacterium aquaticum TaxID=2613962 RepID=A0A5J5GDE2_9RHOB|nr:NADP-dependent oxidoreductase [Histidinibacterium aquaticum]KAA9005970.1 NADP-dependent oxidoreductase [Histidinibacterium aquaticum]
MLAMRIHEFGPSDRLKPEDLETPEPGPGEMLVRTHAAGVNPVDYKIRAGEFPPVGEDKLPLVPGGEVSGVVDAVGEGVESFNAGATVHAMVPPGRGGYATHVIVRPNEAAAIPEGMSWEEAASLPLAGLTAWQGLYEHGEMHSGQRVLIHGGAGGVGHLAVQIAKSAGCEVFTTARADEDGEMLERLGADRVIDYREENFEEIATDLDLVLDTIGGDTQKRSLACLTKGGRLVGTLGGPDEDTVKKHGVTATAFMTQPNGTQLEEMGRAFSQGTLRTNVSQTFPLEEAAKAQDTLENQHVQGKIALTVR